MPILCFKLKAKRLDKAVHKIPVGHSELNMKSFPDILSSRQCKTNQEFQFSTTFSSITAQNRSHKLDCKRRKKNPDNLSRLY